MKIEHIAVLVGLLCVAVAEAQIPIAKGPPVGRRHAPLTRIYSDSSNVSNQAGGNAYGTNGDPRPGYLVRSQQDTFGTTIMRISGDFGLPIGNGALGAWGDRARHSYSKKQPWSMDERYFIMENRCVQVADGASCTTTAGCVGTNPLVLDGETFQPIKSIEFANDSIYDYRWAEYPGYEHWLFNVTDSGTHSFLYNVETGDTMSYLTHPFKSGGGLIGGGEGNASSRSGKYIALSSDVNNNTKVAIVQMFPIANRSVGATFTLPACSLLTCGAANCPIDYVSVTASGQYLDVKYECTEEHRIFPIDTTTLAIGPAPLVLANAPLFCVKKLGGGYHGINGWIGQLKHADTFLNPDDGYKDYIFGESNRCSTLTGAWIDSNWVNVGSAGAAGHYMGRAIMIRLSDGRPRALTAGPTPNSYTGNRDPTWGWGSSRNVRDRDGWIYFVADTSLSRRMGSEVTMIRTDSSRTTLRLGHIHGNFGSCYDYEPHACPSPSGTRVVFASTWRSWCTSDCRSAPTVQDYVIDLRPLSAVNRIAARRSRSPQ